VSKPYQVLPPTAAVPAPNDVLEMIVREGARKMLQAVLEEEVDEFLGRRRYQRTEEHRGHRNGHLPKRTVGVGMGAVEVRLPRVSDVPNEVSPSGFQSEIVARYQRRSRAICPVCGSAFQPVGRGRFCKPRCRQTAYRLRHRQVDRATLANIAERLRREQRLIAQTVYACASCQERVLGERRCSSCNLWCRKVGIGGECSGCSDVVTITELLGMELLGGRCRGLIHSLREGKSTSVDKSSDCSV
jgi:hypothetical protein